MLGYKRSHNDLVGLRSSLFAPDYEHEFSACPSLQGSVL